MTSTALLIIDVQNDFVEGGALGVTGGRAVARGVTAHLDAHRDDYALVVASQDWHDAVGDNGGHFAAEPDYVDTWPVHCVADTPGADFAPDLDVSGVDVRVRKGQGRPSYSAFEGTTEDGRGLTEVLRSAGIERVELVGIATDHCVRASALDAERDGFEVLVRADLTAGVAADTTARALDELGHAGVEVTGEPLRG